MKYLDLTLPMPAENLACDEALLDFCEETDGPEILRVWEPSDYFIVVGYANKVNLEVNCRAATAQAIPILRRCSGGGTIVQGRGCLNYSLILNFAKNNHLQTIAGVNRFIMSRHCELFQKLFQENVAIQGHTDLTIDGRKFSGNAQRRKKNFLLFHGTFLLDFDITMVEQLLQMPSKQPDYRSNRAHGDFLTNLSMQSAHLKTYLRNAWKAFEPLATVPETSLSLIEKYRSPEWNLKF